MTDHKTELNITKIGKYKKLNMTEHKTDMSIIKIDKYKKLTIAEDKTDMNITKIDKYKKKQQKKLNSTSGTEHKRDMNITEIDKYKKTQQHFCDEAQNRAQLHFDESNNKYTQIQQRSNNSQNSP